MRSGCDPLRIEQALNNLVSNAIKYSPRGGEVRITTDTQDGHALISVIDHGMGIDDEELEHIWEPFRRTGISTEMAPGVGLGLSITRRIVEAHGGELRVTSTAGLGSTFTMSIPLLAHGEVGRASEESWQGSPAAPP